MKRAIQIVLVAVIVVALGSVAMAVEILETVVNPDNGHVYHLLTPSTWTQAEAEANGLGGHLVSVGDGGENQWVLNTFGPTTIAAATGPALLAVGMALILPIAHIGEPITSFLIDMMGGELHNAGNIG